MYVALSEAAAFTGHSGRGLLQAPPSREQTKELGALIQSLTCHPFRQPQQRHGRRCMLREC